MFSVYSVANFELARNRHLDDLAILIQGQTSILGVYMLGILDILAQRDHPALRIVMGSSFGTELTSWAGMPLAATVTVFVAQGVLGIFHPGQIILHHPPDPFHDLLRNGF